jgi:mannose-6-phosphate isomerase-like protein (cupin superfamily)
MEGRKDILNAKNNKDIFIFKSFFADVPKWDSFLNHLNYSIKIKDENIGNQGARETVGGVNFWSKLTLTVEKPNSEYFPQLADIENAICEMHNGLSGKFTIISFTDAEPTTGLHNDPVDVFYVQCIGKVIWNIYIDDRHYEYELGEGDVIFVPSGINHEIKSLGPRAAISFMFDKGA